MEIIKIDPYLEEFYLKMKYGENADLELARMYEKMGRETKHLTNYEQKRYS